LFQSRAGLPDFSSYEIPKPGKLSILRPSKTYPNWNFWYENVPSGNPEAESFRPEAVFLIRFLKDVLCFKCQVLLIEHSNIRSNNKMSE
jgi:hypothetical protein